MYDYDDKPIASTPPAEQGCELMEPPGVLGHIIFQTSSGPYGQPGCRQVSSLFIPTSFNSVFFHLFHLRVMVMSARSTLHRVHQLSA